MSKDTLQLPKTAFSMKASLFNKEPQILEKWEKNKIFERLRRSSKGKEKFVLHDGPPYANGHIHMGTALNKILKDNNFTDYKIIKIINEKNSLVREILTSSSIKKEMHFNYKCLSLRSSITAILSYEATGC